jgi:glycosyltransferase involved in cell wall biosynthesis
VIGRVALWVRFAVSRQLDNDPDWLIASALAEARRKQRRPICVAASFPLTEAEIASLANNPLVGGIVAKHNNDTLQQLEEMFPAAKLGAYWEPGRWVLPSGARHVYLVGSWRLITLQMLRAAIRQNVVTLTARCSCGWIDIPLRSIRRVAEQRYRLRPILPIGRVAIGKTASAFARINPRRIAAASGPLNVPLSASADVRPVERPPRSLDAELLGSIIDNARSSHQFRPVRGRVLLVCGNLQPGGAERQVAYTARGLAGAKCLESVGVLCDFLAAGHPSRHDFYRPLLTEAAVPAEEIRRRYCERAAVNEPAAFARHRGSFPEGFLLDVANLYEEFVQRRPEIVHAWLDWSNTRAGLAAALAGVPRILLSGRNLSPTHFQLYQPYMDPVYQALCALPNVVLLNNSRAGAEDYAAWLKLPRERLRVIPNGFDTELIDRSTAQAMSRRSVGIPDDVPLIGGIFRLAGEKRPLLWVEVAARVAAANPNAWFVIFGDGALRQDMERAARRLGLANRFVMAGVTDDPMAAMRLMDVFLLTSYGEGVPNVVLEAQYAGVPVVATNAGGTAETVQEGLTGWIEYSDEPHRLADRMTWLLSEDVVRARCRFAGPEFVRSQFGLQRMIDQTLDAYDIATEPFVESNIPEVTEYSMPPIVRQATS